MPVGAAVKMLPEILDMFKAEETASGSCRKTVIDVCSTKEQLSKTAHYHPMRTHYVATHPMAGTEYSGPWAAMPGLFDGRACIICNQEESAPAAVRMVERLYDCLNMRSHISHITSFALALTVLDKEKNEKHIFDLASGGFSSTVRLAKSNADMWVPVFSQNRENLLKVIDTYIEKVNAFRQAIDEFDEDGIPHRGCEPYQADYPLIPWTDRPADTGIAPKVHYMKTIKIDNYGKETRHHSFEGMEPFQSVQ